MSISGSHSIYVYGVVFLYVVFCSNFIIWRLLAYKCTGLKSFIAMVRFSGVYFHFSEIEVALMFFRICFALHWTWGYSFFGHFSKKF